MTVVCARAGLHLTSVKYVIKVADDVVGWTHRAPTAYPTLESQVDLKRQNRKIGELFVK